VSRLTLADADGLGDALGSLAFGPWRSWSFQATPDRRVDYWLDEIRAVLSRPGGALFLADRGGVTAGLATLAEQPWETRVLGRRMAEIRHLASVAEPRERSAVLERLLEEVLRQAEHQGAECLSHRPYANDAPGVHALERSGFLLVDTLLDCTYDFDGGRELPAFPAIPDVQIRLAGPEDVSGLVDVARHAFVRFFGRFHSDGRIPGESAIRVYEEWIRSCVEGWADWVLAAESRGILVGYSAWKRPSELEIRHGIGLGHYSIGAVHPDHAARGLFRALTEQGMRLLAGRVERIEGPTHVNNVRVQHAYATLGWRVSDARHGFHRWLRP
jgi:GNAT superfamily N-acetyltransferase